MLANKLNGCNTSLCVSRGCRKLHSSAPALPAASRAARKGEGWEVPRAGKAPAGPVWAGFVPTSSGGKGGEDGAQPLSRLGVTAGWAAAALQRWAWGFITLSGTSAWILLCLTIISGVRFDGKAQSTTHTAISKSVARCCDDAGEDFSVYLRQILKMCCDSVCFDPLLWGRCTLPASVRWSSHTVAFPPQLVARSFLSPNAADVFYFYFTSWKEEGEWREINADCLWYIINLAGNVET